MSATPIQTTPFQTTEDQALTLSRFIETVLFVAEAPVTLLELIEIYTRANPDQLAPNEEQLHQAFDILRNRCQGEGYIYMLQPIAGGWQLLTKLQYAPIARQAIVQREQKKLSRAALETLAIVAYRQPVTKAEVEFIRGVASDYAVQKLLDKQLIEPAGRAELPGKPMLYRTTRHFMEFFGLTNLSDLPKLQDLQLDEEALEQSLQEALRRTNEPTETANPNSENHEGE